MSAGSERVAADAADGTPGGQPEAAPVGPVERVRVLLASHPSAAPSPTWTALKSRLEAEVRRFWMTLHACDPNLRPGTQCAHMRALLAGQFGTEAVTIQQKAIKLLLVQHARERMGEADAGASGRWQADSDAVTCSAPECNTQFGMFVRKHHCRGCGLIFCDSCSPKNPAGVRLCKYCNHSSPEVLRAEQAGNAQTGFRAGLGKLAGGVTGVFRRKSTTDQANANVDAQRDIKPRYSTLRPSTAPSLTSNPEDQPCHLDKEQIPEDKGDRFNYACIIGAIFSNDYFDGATDPGELWRKAELKLLLEELDISDKLDVVLQCMDSAVVDPLPLIVHFASKGDESRVDLVRTYVQLTAKLGVYDARARSCAFTLAAQTGMSRHKVVLLERDLAQSIIQVSEEASEEVLQEIEDRKKSDKMSRRLKIGFLGLAGGVLIGVTAGLAAPLVAVGATAVAGAGAGAAIASGGGAIVLGSLFGAGGAGLLAHKSNRRFGDLTEFDFVRLPTGISAGNQQDSLSVVITVPGWVTTNPNPSLGEGYLYSAGVNTYIANDYVIPTLSADFQGEAYTLVWESKKLFALSNALNKFASEQLVAHGATTALKHTVLATLMAALVVPATLIAASDLIDNPWGVCVEAANAAGVELANVLVERVQGARPVTLVAWSMGALVVAAALKELTQRSDCFGLIENVYLFGLPASGQSHHWDAVANLVSGRLVNFHSENDWFLKLMLRGLTIEKCVAGLEGINHKRFQNVNASAMIELHSDWAIKMPRLLQLAGLSTLYSDEPFQGNVGDRVRVHGKGTGTLMHYGWINEKEPLLHSVSKLSEDAEVDSRRPEWLGISLDAPLGNCDGRLKHDRYFTCLQDHGLVVPAREGQVTLMERTSARGFGDGAGFCYSSTCRRRKAVGCAGSCYAPQCRVDILHLAHISPPPVDESMVSDSESAKSSSWGIGRLLRTERDESQAEATGVIVTVDLLQDCQIRFTNCESGLIEAAVYTIALATALTSDKTKSRHDWTVCRTFAELQRIHNLLQSEMTAKYTQTTFPDSLFMTAARRMPLLQKWLQDALQVLAFVKRSSQQKIALLLGATLATVQSPPSTKTKPQTLIIPIGPSKQNKKTVQLPQPYLRLSSTPVNKQEPQWTDRFDLMLADDGISLTVTRTDEAGGWQQKLELMATVQDSPENSIITTAAKAGT